MASSVVDDQEILKLKKILGKKRRDSLGSSASLVKESCELSQFLNGDSTTVYALVEVSNSSEKSGKMEKIPLSNRDFYLMMQKFFNSKRRKADRKILRPSLKRKFGLEYADSNAKILKEHFSHYEIPETLGLSDRVNVTHNSSNRHPFETLSNGEKNDIHYRIKTRNNECKESEHSDLKILYNRNRASESIETKYKHRINSVSRGTNTDIVQTPKVLEEVLQALNLNFHLGLEENKSKTGREEIDSEKRKVPHASPDTSDTSDNSNNGKDRSPINKFLLVPFIITSKQFGICKKSNSCDSIRNGERKSCRNPSVVDLKFPPSEVVNCAKNPKSSRDLRTGINPINIHLNALQGIKIDYRVKNGMVYNKEGTLTELEGPSEPATSRVKCFFEEVKTLQMKLNSIIKGLEMNNLFPCNHNIGEPNGKKDEANDLPDTYYIRNLEECANSLDSLMLQSNWQWDKFNSTPVLPHGQPSPRETERSHDFSVQVVLEKSLSDKTITMSSNKTSDIVTVDKSLMLDKLSQFPSDVKIEPMVKCLERRTLIPSKSSPLLHPNVECRIDKTKRTCSLPPNDDMIEGSDYLKLKTIDLKFDGSRPDSGDQLEEKESMPIKGVSEGKLDSESCKSNAQAEITTDVLLKKKSTTIVTQDEKGLFTVKPGGKIAKIKIVGNTVLNDKSREGEVDKIKVELDETSSIKISNKFTKKAKTNVNKNNNPPTKCNNSRNANDNLHSTVRDTIDVKSDVESKKHDTNKKQEGNSKIARKENAAKKTGGLQVQKQAKAPEKTSMHTTVNVVNEGGEPRQQGQKISRLKKPATPIRSTSKGKENGSDPSMKSTGISPSKAATTPAKAEEVEVSRVSKKMKSIADIPPPPEQSCDVVEPPVVNKSKKNLQNFLETSSYDGPRDVHSDEPATAVTHKCSTTSCSQPISVPPSERTNADKQSEAVKSIWALTKVILYKDGSQSFEVLEASSNPPGYHLSKTKKKDIGENCDFDSSNTNATTPTPTDDATNNDNNNRMDSSDLNNCTSSEEKSR